MRIQQGMWVVGVCGVAVGLGACTSSPPPLAEREPSAQLVESAASAGVDLDGGPPQRTRDRLLGVFAEGRTVDHAELRFDDGVYYERGSGDVFSGYASSSHASGSARSVHGIVDGRLEGPGVWCYDDGSIWIATTYRGGSMRGQILEFFPSGRMKLRAMAHELSPSGGVRVEEISVGEFASDGYRQRGLGRGRLQMIRPDGTTDSSNATIAVPEQSGYMLFHRAGILGERAYTTDSRRIDDAR